MEQNRDTKLPDRLPLPLRWLRAHGLRGLTPWHFIDSSDQSAGLRAQFRREMRGGSQPEQDFLPFAERQDCDDVAGFVVENGEILNAVIVVHLTWAPAGAKLPTGVPTIHRYQNLWEWLKMAIDESSLRCSEEDMPKTQGEPGAT